MIATRLYTVAVNAAYCKGCEICVNMCPRKVFRINERQKAEAAHADECIGCLTCELYCPDFAIEVQEVEFND